MVWGVLHRTLGGCAATVGAATAARALFRLSPRPDPEVDTRGEVCPPVSAEPSDTAYIATESAHTVPFRAAASPHRLRHRAPCAQTGGTPALPSRTAALILASHHRDNENHRLKSCPYALLATPCRSGKEIRYWGFPYPAATRRSISFPP